jgi:hypothetical protein
MHADERLRGRLMPGVRQLDDETRRTGCLEAH